MDECCKAYERLSGDIFPYSGRRSFMWFQPKLDLHTLEESISQIVQEYAPAALQRCQEDVFASDPIQCKTVILSFEVKSGKPYLFSTYGLSERKGTQDNAESDEKIIWNVKVTPLGPNDKPEHDHKGIASLMRIVDAAKATSAAPTYFRPLRVRAGSQVYVDGGLAANNPSLLIYNEFKQLRGKAVQVEKESDPSHETSESSGTFVEEFVSIGVSKERISLTGAKRDSTRSILRRNSDLRRKVQALAEPNSVSSNQTHKIMQSLTQNREIGKYWRLITDSSLSILSWEDWQKIRTTRRQASSNLHFDRYRLDRARNLAGVKRGCEATDRWQSFAGPLCYSRGQLAAESTDFGDWDKVRKGSKKEISYSSSGHDSLIPVGAVRLFATGYLDAVKILNSSTNPAILHAPHLNNSARAYAFI